MIQGFTVLTGKRPQAAPSLKVTKHGIFINAEARRQLGGPARVQVGIDESGNRLAVCPVEEGGIALSGGHTCNRGIMDQVIAVFGEGRVLEGRLVDGGMMFEAGEED